MTALGQAISPLNVEKQNTSFFITSRTDDLPLLLSELLFNKVKMQKQPPEVFCKKMCS